MFLMPLIMSGWTKEKFLSQIEAVTPVNYVTFTDYFIKFNCLNRYNFTFRECSFLNSDNGRICACKISHGYLILRVRVVIK